MTRRIRITHHAVERFLQRVDPAASHTEAKRIIGDVIDGGRCRPAPRRWMKTVRPAPGLTFVYSAEHPGIALAVRNSTVVTVYSKSTCRRWNESRSEPSGRAVRGCRKVRGSKRRTDLTPSPVLV